MGEYADIAFSLGPDREISLTSAAGAFTPTGTSKLLVEAVQEAVRTPATILDLGCGTGVVGLALFLRGLVKPPLFASDVSEVAWRCSRMNFERYDCPYDVRRGSLFEPWSGHRFDVIVDDISGVAEEVAEVSPWFKGVPCSSGKDGTALVVGMISEACGYLTNHGRLLFPVISLSNVDLVLDEARRRFSTVERVARQEWPLPDELSRHMALLERLREDGCIRLEKRFGMVLWYTEIYCASNG